MHKLLLLNFYPFLQKYIAPHQRDVTQVGACCGNHASNPHAIKPPIADLAILVYHAPPQVLAALVQGVHELVPPETLQPVLRQLVDQFVHDRRAAS